MSPEQRTIEELRADIENKSKALPAVRKRYPIAADRMEREITTMQSLITKLETDAVQEYRMGRPVKSTKSLATQ